MHSPDTPPPSPDSTTQPPPPPDPVGSPGNQPPPSSFEQPQTTSRDQEFLSRLPSHTVLRSVLGVFLGTALGVIVSVIIALPVRLLSDTIFGAILGESTSTTASYFECAVIGCTLAAFLACIIALLSLRPPRKTLLILAGTGAFVCLAGGYGASRIADMVAVGIADQYYTYGNVFERIGDLFGGSEPVDDVTSNIGDFLDNEGDAVYNFIAADMRWDAFIWVAMACLAAIGFGAAVTLLRQKPPRDWQFDLSVMAALGGYLAVEWHTGATTVLGWTLLGMVLATILKFFQKPDANPVSFRKITLICLTIGLVADILFGDETLIWKITIAVSVWLAAWVTAAATLPEGRIDPRHPSNNP